MFIASKLFSTVTLCCTIAIAGLLSFAQPVFAFNGDNARFAACQQLKTSNSVKWYGIASGIEDSTYSIHEYGRSFHAKACFSNERACRTWVKRIWWEIPTMEELRTAYCKRI